MSDKGAMVRARAIEQRSPHNRLVTVILFLLFGPFGVHRFYVGKTGSGIAMALTTIFSFGVIGGIWWIYDLIQLLTGRFTDADGRVLGPPQIVYETAAPEPKALPSYEPELEPVKDDSPDWEDEVMRDPLEDEFAKLEKEMNS